VLEFAEWLQVSALSVSIQSAGWVIPLLQSIHILTIGIVFVSILVVALRVLGRMRVDESLDQVVRRFAPWIWCGLVVMAATGLLLVIGEPVRQVTATSYWLKMTLLAAAITSAALFGRAQKGAVADAAGAVPSSSIKLAAIGTLVLWLAIIFLGRAIAYDVEVWGAWSLTQHV
jgi:uncharacterized membrane protein SirB2